jgi:lipid-A-disaccharide synthase-like uncharacterized protein
MNLNPSSWTPWVALGFAGQLCFSARFLVQWLWSEKQKQSVVPVYFWYFSLLGGAILTVYAYHRRDPVFLVGQLFGLLVYTRNLMLIRGRRTAVPLSE